ncbi:hypothetical protein SVIO_085080 [Streptomyces violaceusniger]|uniref:Uncharacterized protein n=1 Tax=Streptomyces violaceusniger TaxID=68280 RepID=A0A4D4L9U7_STRVO|nr:hypothetical protein SVIO_085080 [Streptomyces violaceusniger]
MEGARRDAKDEARADRATALRRRDDALRRAAETVPGPGPEIHRADRSVFLTLLVEGWGGLFRRVRRGGQERHFTIAKAVYSQAAPSAAVPRPPSAPEITRAQCLRIHVRRMCGRSPAPPSDPDGGR